jgi:hypothetical protein
VIKIRGIFAATIGVDARLTLGTPDQLAKSQLCTSFGHLRGQSFLIFRRRARPLRSSSPSNSNNKSLSQTLSVLSCFTGTPTNPLFLLIADCFFSRAVRCMNFLCILLPLLHALGHSSRQWTHHKARIQTTYRRLP